MISGIGTDIVDNERIEKIFSKFGFVFANKILSNSELRDFESSQEKINFLAKRFASKEALSKAIGIGLYRHGLSPKIIEISHDNLGKPFININDELNNILSMLSITHIHLSISDTKKLSTAVVISESR